MALAFDVALALLLPVLAWIAMAHRRLMGGIVYFVVYGLVLAIAWYRLEAPDVALAEAAIGAGITGVLLIGAVSRLERSARERRKDGRR